MSVFETNPEIVFLFAGLLAILVIGTSTGMIMGRTVRSESGIETVRNINSRMKAWWLMCIVFTIAVLTVPAGSIVMFSLTSFLAFREYVTIAPTRRGDHRVLFWAFFILLPLNYLLLYMKWYGLFSILIPVYAFLFVPIRKLLTNDVELFLQRTAEILWGLMVCIYFISHVPALMLLDIPGYSGKNATLLFFLVLVVELNDVMQYVWGKWLGKRKICPDISPNKTVAGTVGGILTSSFVGMLLWWATPFNIWQALGLSLMISVMGFFGDLTMSAVKRDRGVKDYGSLLPGHGGILDRIDSLCFSAPLFFHVVRYFFT